MTLSLRAIAVMIEDNTNATTVVKETWIDYGAGIKQDQIVVKEKDDKYSYQLLTPRELGEVEIGIYTIEQVQDHIDVINGIKKPYWER